MISCGNKSCKEERRKSTLHELGQDEIPAAPKIRLLLLKRWRLIAGAACAGGDAGKRGQQGAQKHYASDQGGTEMATNVVNRFRKRVDLF